MDHAIKCVFLMISDLIKILFPFVATMFSKRIIELRIVSHNYQ